MEAEARTDVDWQGGPAEAGATPPHRGARAFVSRAPVTDHDIFDNRLIFGDNPPRLEGAEQVHGQGQMRLIDPPHNTGSAFEHYDDGVEHWSGYR